jgi:hypothetical protein
MLFILWHRLLKQELCFICRPAISDIEEINNTKYIVNQYKSSYIGNINMDINQQTKGLLYTLKNRNQKIFDMVKKLCKLYYKNLKWFKRCSTSSYYCDQHNYLQCKSEKQIKDCYATPEYYLVDTNNIVVFNDENFENYNEEQATDKRIESGDYFKLENKYDLNDFIITKNNSGGQKCKNMLKFLEFLGLVKEDKDMYIEKEDNPIHIYNKTCGVKFLNGQKDYFTKIENNVIYEGQIIYFSPDNTSGGLYQIIKYNKDNKNNKVNIEIKNKKMDVHIINKTDEIKPFYFYPGQIIKNTTNNEFFEIIDLDLSKFLSDKDSTNDIKISPYKIEDIQT